MKPGCPKLAAGGLLGGRTVRAVTTIIYFWDGVTPDTDLNLKPQIKYLSSTALHRMLTSLV